MAANRQAIVDDLLFNQVYTVAENLKEKLGYKPIIYDRGKPAVHPTDTTRVVIVINRQTISREPMTIRGTMWETRASADILFSVPERDPKVAVHDIVQTACYQLVDYYTDLFCSQAEQLYIDNAHSEVDMLDSSRTGYTVTIDYHFMDYPNRRLA